MRILIKILLFPVVVVLTIFVAICRFLCRFSTVLLSIAAFLLFVFALGTLFLLKDTRGGIEMMVTAYLISPYGIPLFASFLIEAIDTLNGLIKSI
ncbi:MAG: CD1845 family protein [Oscillospiraceae bacterium]|jgi:hypothetical protein|nr:CD1845 family protein [Oscillospiraceae bacterium]